MKRIAVLAVGLFAITLGLYLQTHAFLFVSWDDTFYIYRNGMFDQGVTAQTIKRCFTENVVANWHPLTMLSLTADVALSGGRSYEFKTKGRKSELSAITTEKGEIQFKEACDSQEIARRLKEVSLESSSMRKMSCVMHLHNAILHACNAVWVFLLLIFLGQVIDGQENKNNPINSQRASARFLFCAFFSAAFWAWHPLRVESVAWVSERKDVLFLFWYLIGSLAWIKRETSTSMRPCAYWIGATFVCLAFALLAKPQAVTFPLTAVLISIAISRKIRWGSFVSMCMLSGGTTVITLFFQEEAEAIRSEFNHGSDRILNACASLWAYLRMTVWPERLSFFYVYERPVPIIKALPGIGLIILSCWLLFFCRKRKNVQTDFSNPNNIFFRIEQRIVSFCDLPWLFLGLGWFLGTLLPVIGIIHVGKASHADRYTYLPGIGLSIVIMFILLYGLRRKQVWISVGIVVSCLGCLLLTSIKGWQRINVWHDSHTLFGDALLTDPENYKAHENLGFLYLYEGNYEQALRHLVMAIHEDGSTWEVAYHHILTGEPFLETINKDVNFLEIAIDDINDPLAGLKHQAKGISALARNCPSFAASEFEMAMKLLPENGYVAFLLGKAFIATERYDEAKKAVLHAELLLPKNSRYRKFLPAMLSVIDQKQ